MHTRSDSPNSPLHELSITEAAAAIRTASITASAYASALLERAHALADLRAFITLDEQAVLESARQADLDRQAGKSLGPLHGVPIAIKDSFNTRDMPTSIGTKVLAAHRPSKDATVVKAMRDAGAILFGKNNLVEMSYGLTGLNAHYGQARNPYDPTRVTGGSSSGAGASVAARIVPAALGGDTVGSIRVPASLCGIVGFRPSTGRWPARGIAPISHTLDTPGPMARTVEDCALLDAVARGQTWSMERPNENLRGVRLGFAPRQHLDRVDAEIEACFRDTLTQLREAGVELVEIDLGDDFASLAEQANWPIFIAETMPHVTQYLREQEIPASFQDIYAGLGDNVKAVWADKVMAGSPNAIPEAVYRKSLEQRVELQRRYGDAYRSHEIHALLFPTTPTAAPSIDAPLEDPLRLARNVFASSCAGLPGISIPVGFSAAGLPIGMEIDGPPHGDDAVLAIAARISRIIGPLPSPRL